MLENTSFLPTYNVSPEQKSAYIRQMLPLMLKHNIPVDPINYAVWYHYVAGTNADLNKTIDGLIDGQKSFDSETSLKLYTKYVCKASLESFEEINSNLLQLISQLSRSVNDAGEKASAVGDNINVRLKELNDRKDGSGLNSILVEIILETTKLADASRDLKIQLQNTDKEIDRLRNELTVVRETARIDGLTGLLNRYAFDMALNELIKDAPAKKACLAMLDIDNFKRVNDSFGHLVGDKVIRHVASLLKIRVPEHHQVARFGGEEIAVIMPETTLAEAFNLIDKTRAALDASRLKYKNDTIDIGKITVSAGIASLHAPDSADSLIARADQALYLAKKTGRNKVVTEDGILDR
jgi:diguanylate cyclase